MFVPGNRLLDNKIDTGYHPEPTADTSSPEPKNENGPIAPIAIVRDLGRIGHFFTSVQAGPDTKAPMLKDKYISPSQIREFYIPISCSELIGHAKKFMDFADPESYDEDEWSPTLYIDGPTTVSIADADIADISEEDRQIIAQQMLDSVIEQTDRESSEDAVLQYAEAQYLSGLMTLRNTSGLAVGITRKAYPHPRDLLEASINDSFARVTNAIDGLQQAIDKANTLDLDTLHLQQLKDRLEQTITRDTTAATETGAENSSTEGIAQVTDARETNQNRVDALIGELRNDAYAASGYLDHNAPLLLTYAELKNRLRVYELENVIAAEKFAEDNSDIVQLEGGEPEHDSDKTSDVAHDNVYPLPSAQAHNNAQEPKAS